MADSEQQQDANSYFLITASPGQSGLKRPQKPNATHQEQAAKKAFRSTIESLGVMASITHTQSRPEAIPFPQNGEDENIPITATTITTCTISPNFLDKPQSESRLFLADVDAPFLNANLEHNLQRLRAQRLKERENALYIPPQAKPTLQSSDDTLFPLMEKVQEFLAGTGQVLLLLGDSGGGKSTFNLQLEHTLWMDYEEGGPIPLHINLPAINNPQKNMIDEQLQQLRLFSENQIQELRLHRQFVVICDGYDESQLKQNIYTSNFLNQPEQWRAKMVISCRSQYLGLDYRARFQPAGDRYQQPMANLFQEAVIAPFSKTQIEQYVEQFVQKAPSQSIGGSQSSWTVADYIDRLNKIPKLIELVSNPFLLMLALRALPNVVCSGDDLSNIRLTRVGLYDSFIEQWLEMNKHRLNNSTLSTEARAVLDELLDAEFVQVGIDYQKDLASAIFQHQGGNPVVKYIQHREGQSWKTVFFSTDAKITMLRESSPLTRSGNQYRFLHRSILEYLYSRVVSDPFEPSQLSEHIGSGTSNSVESFVEHPINQRSIVGEPSILRFLAERVELEPSFKSRLLTVIEDSKMDAGVSQAAANAMSILVRAGVRFNRTDLRNISIPGADICGGQFDSADMQGADLSDVNLANTWLRQANLSDTKMTGVQFGELPYLEIGESVVKCVFSPDGALLVLSTKSEKIIVYDTATWTKVVNHAGGWAVAISPTTREIAKQQDRDIDICDILTGNIRLVLSGHSDSINHISYSPDGKTIATSSNDYTIRIWSTSSGHTLHVLLGHTDRVFGVAISPTGLQLVSCSEDKTVRTWNAQTGQPLLIIEEHADPVLSVAYSQDSRQIVSADENEGLVLWDANTGSFIHDLVGHSFAVCCAVYSPDGHQLASCGADTAVRLWNPNNGELFDTLSGHNGTVNSISFSPDGKHIASSSLDGTMRLWDVGRALPREESSDNMTGWWYVDISSDGAWSVTGNKHGEVQLWETRTGMPGAALTGNEGDVNEVAFSPCGELVASAGADGTVRLWCARTGKSVNVLQGHTGTVFSVAFSPSGHQLASGGGISDRTVRFCDPRTGESGLVLEGHTKGVNDLAFSPSGHQIASCSDDTTVRLWCTLTGEQLTILHHEEALDRVMFSPDGLEVISISRTDGDLCCWNIQSGEMIDQSTLKNYDILCCSYSPCGRILATGERDGMLRLWDRELGGSNWSEVYRSCIGRFVCIRWIHGLDGIYLATSEDGIVRVWEMIEVGGSYTLHKLWSLGRNELSMADANLSGAVGLSPADLKLVKQRGAITESDIQSYNHPFYRTTLPATASIPRPPPLSYRASINAGLSGTRKYPRLPKEHRSVIFTAPNNTATTTTTTIIITFTAAPPTVLAAAVDDPGFRLEDDIQYIAGLASYVMEDTGQTLGPLTRGDVPELGVGCKNKTDALKLAQEHDRNQSRNSENGASYGSSSARNGNITTSIADTTTGNYQNQAFGSGWQGNDGVITEDDDNCVIYHQPALKAKDSVKGKGRSENMRSQPAQPSSQARDSKVESIEINDDEEYYQEHFSDVLTNDIMKLGQNNRRRWMFWNYKLCQELDKSTKLYRQPMHEVVQQQVRDASSPPPYQRRTRSCGRSGKRQGRRQGHRHTLDDISEVLDFVNENAEAIENLFVIFSALQYLNTQICREKASTLKAQGWNRLVTLRSRLPVFADCVPNDEIEKVSPQHGGQGKAVMVVGATAKSKFLERSLRPGSLGADPEALKLNLTQFPQHLLQHLLQQLLQSLQFVAVQNSSSAIVNKQSSRRDPSHCGGFYSSSM
ncbi:MAG: hypothetical protein J3R72DRAFT_492329 [Linnemannia gamsii]|nr:MAG: hypothetical protein J3R72DRAFT_492329 [Linnemannia gamsii]